MHRYLPMALLLLVACPRQAPVTPAVDAPVAPPRAPAGVDDSDLADLLRDAWEQDLRDAPTWATRMGDHRYDDRLPDLSAEARDAQAEHDRALLARADALASTHLSDRDQTTLQLFQWRTRRALDRRVCRFDEWAVSVRGNPLTRLESFVETHPRRGPEDDETLRARLRAVPTMVEQQIARLRSGLGDGLVANAESVRRVVAMIDRWMELPAAEHDPLVAELDSILRPSFVAYRAVLTDEVLPAARDDQQVGLATLGPGAGCYQALIAWYTTLPLDPEAVHRTGLEQLESIHAEFSELGDRLWGERDVATIFERLRTDPALYFETEEQVEDKARSALASAAEVMDQAFGRLPRAECGVERVPAVEAPFTTIAYYRRPAPDGSRPGTYFVNTYAPTTRPRHEAEVLAFHEAIPGHHLQISIAQELGDLPAFRRNTGATAFVEGWALYIERLADEMGLYSGDLDRMGMLSFDAWRAARLVVDTGLHHQGWSRQQAVDFLLANTPLAPNNVDNEVDRYISTPGQALAYKVGQLQMWALRRQAEDQLGDRFDLRAFHDVVLGGGAVTLPVLRERVERWIAAGGPPPPR